MRVFLKLAVLAASLAVAGLDVPGVQAREVPIGSITYEARPEREIVTVGGREGEFTGFRFEVRQSDVEITDLRIVYANGQTEDVRLRQLFRAGSSSRVIELANPRRALRQIIVNYVPRGPARIVFFGVSGMGGGGGSAGGDWVRLGCKDVKFLLDRDTIKVDGADGLFRALRLKVRKAPVEMFSLRVTMGNGARLEVPVREYIPAGGGTRPIDLPGGARGIDRIEMVYRSVPTLAGTAEVCIDGLDRY